MLLSLIFGIMIGAVAVLFALQNIFPVTVTFMVWELTTSVAVVISLAILMGLIISALLYIPEAIKNIFVISRLKNENKKLSDELEAIKKIEHPVVDLGSTEPPLVL